jgi:UDP-glucuronate 4-epimerase
MRILLTGAAGFIGFHFARTLLDRSVGDRRVGDGSVEVLGLDSLNDYYDPALKAGRLDQLRGKPGFTFRQTDIADTAALEAATQDFAADVVVHLAAQAGVRYSIDNPMAYVEANIRGQLNMLEYARRTGVRMLYASSSSVYGNRSETPFRETDRCDHPVSVYAASKRSGELLSGVYADMYGLSLTGLRFFTVYGPWGRPDMAYWLFTDAILNGRPIRMFNSGEMRRDFTDVRDIVAGMLAMIDNPAPAGHHLYNIGHSEPVTLARFVAAIESAIGRPAVREMAPMQPGDVGDTFADVSRLEADYGYRPAISIEDGVKSFVDWYRQRYSL